MSQHWSFTSVTSVKLVVSCIVNIHEVVQIHICQFFPYVCVRFVICLNTVHFSIYCSSGCTPLGSDGSRWPLILFCLLFRYLQIFRYLSFEFLFSVLFFPIPIYTFILLDLFNVINMPINHQHQLFTQHTQ